jgi:CRISPR-associated endoribonuclease Cas6
MRLKISFSTEDSFFIPFKSNLEIYTFIMDILKKAGIEDRIFNYSPFRSMNREITQEGIILKTPIHIYISSPVEEYLSVIREYIGNAGDIELFSTILTLEKIIEIPNISFSNDTYKFKCLSPITVLKKIIVKGDDQKEVFLNPHDSEFYAKLRIDLTEKYRKLYGTFPKDARLFIEFDKEYIGKKKKISKLIDIKGKKIKGWLAPFTMAGNGKLIQIAYDWGLGRLNDYGFGMIDIVKT